MQFKAASLLFIYIPTKAMKQKEFYKTTSWRKARQAYIDYRKSIDGGMCEECGEELGKIVHHKIWLNDNNCNDPNISLNPENFKYVCQTCHNKEKDPTKVIPGRCSYGPNGEVYCNTEY